MTLTIKAYLKRADDPAPEIRRFTLDHDVTSNFEYLSSKIAQVFPSLGSPDRFTLAWKDSDGDSITFSSDDELIDALTSLEENLLRVYIHEKKPKKKQQGTAASAEGEVFHPGVVCDGCEGRIRGPRFKCLVCPDYDLCKECEEKGLHPEHEFVKFRKPGIGRSHTGGFKWSPGIWRGFGHPGWRHWWWQQQRQGGGPSCGPRDPPSGPCGPRSGPPQGPRGHCWGPGQTTGGASTEGQDQQQGQRGFPSEEESRDFMQHIGEQVAEMLDPLGIDVDIETSVAGMRRKCNKGRGKGRGNKCGGRGKHGNKEEGASSSNMETATSGVEGEKQKEDTAKSADSMETESGTSGKKDGACGSNDEGDWTMVTEGTSADAAEGIPSTAPHINDAIEQLQSMGFDDENGWLTHLVEAKGGDINRILDTIRLNIDK